MNELLNRFPVVFGKIPIPRLFNFQLFAKVYSYHIILYVYIFFFKIYELKFSVFLNQPNQLHLVMDTFVLAHAYMITVFKQMPIFRR